MHNSQRMCLALYANGMLRLWNLLDARCNFKKKVGLEDEDESSKEADDDESSEKEEDAKTIAVKFLNNPQIVKWEPRLGKMYAVLFDRVLEIYNVESEELLHKISFDTQQTGFDFVTSTSIVVSDDKGRLTLLTQVDKSDTV